MFLISIQALRFYCLIESRQQKASLLHQSSMTWIGIQSHVAVTAKTLLLCWLVLHPMEHTFIITQDLLGHGLQWLELTPSTLHMTPPILHQFVFITCVVCICNLCLNVMQVMMNRPTRKGDCIRWHKSGRTLATTSNYSDEKDGKVTIFSYDNKTLCFDATGSYSVYILSSKFIVHSQLMLHIILILARYYYSFLQVNAPIVFLILLLFSD